MPSFGVGNAVQSEPGAPLVEVAYLIVGFPQDSTDMMFDLRVKVSVTDVHRHVVLADFVVGSAAYRVGEAEQEAVLRGA